MDRISVLEREIEELRKTLNEREMELHVLKKLHITNTPVTERPNIDINNIINGDKLPRWAIERYCRQILVPEIGTAGQSRICQSRVLIVGAGGLGCPAGAYLAGAGVGEIGIVDYDTVEITNIHRQILHSEQDRYLNKVDSLADSLRRINSTIKVTTYNVQLDSKNALDIISKYDVVLDCTDNIPTRYLVNDACVLVKVPLISASALKLEGQLTIYGYRENKVNSDKSMSNPCYRCVFPVPANAETVGSCSTSGIVGPVTGTIGSLQALEAIKLIAGNSCKNLLVGRMLLFDGADCIFRVVKLRNRNPDCASCSETPSITKLIDYEGFCKTRAKEEKKMEAKLKSQKRKLEKEKRMSGQSYYGFRKTGVATKKWIQDVPKSERQLGPRCASDVCTKRKCCNDFSDATRIDIFNRFWNEFDWNKKRIYVRSLIDNVPAKRRRSKIQISRKGDSKRYHLLNGDHRQDVCLPMFLNTLGLKEATVRYWLKESRVKKKKMPVKSINVAEYLDSLEKFPPKCLLCRNSTSKHYVDFSIKNLYQLYKKYVLDCKMRGLCPVSRKTFTGVANSKNVGIFKPKNETDICDMVTQHNELTPSLNDHHLQEQILYISEF